MHTIGDVKMGNTSYQNVVITGGAGFIGSHMVDQILKDYPTAKVIVLDCLSYAGKLSNIEQALKNSRCSFIKGDIRSKVAVDKVLNKADVVINCAAESHVDRSIESADDFLTTNVLGTHNLLNAAKKYAVKLFIQVSTDEVYGSYQGESNGFTEEDPMLPNNPYSASKTGADALVRSFYVTHRLPVIITRCCNNYGPRQFPEKLIPVTILNAHNNKAIPIYGDGKQRREWLHVQDHCRAISLLLSKGIPGEVYNIGSGEEVANINLVSIICKNMQRPESLITFVKDRPGHDRRYLLNCKKINHLGWHPIIDLENGLYETINWYISDFRRSDFM